MGSRNVRKIHQRCNDYLIELIFKAIIEYDKFDNNEQKEKILKYFDRLWKIESSNANKILLKNNISTKISPTLFKESFIKIYNQNGKQSEQLPPES